MKNVWSMGVGHGTRGTDSKEAKQTRKHLLHVQSLSMPLKDPNHDVGKPTLVFGERNKLNFICSQC